MYKLVNKETNEIITTSETIIDCWQVNEGLAEWIEIIPEPLTIEEQANIIAEKYQPKLDSYQKLILNAISTGGALQSVKIASFQQKYNALLAQQNEEMEALYI